MLGATSAHGLVPTYPRQWVRASLTQRPRSARLDGAANAFEFLDKSGDPLEDALLGGEVFRVEWSHFGERFVECGAGFAGVPVL